MPIHDQGYRRYAGTRAAVGRGWAVITRSGVKSLFAQARIYRPAPSRLVAVRGPRGADLRCRRISPRRQRSSASRPRPSASSSITGHIRVLRHHLCWRRIDRQRSARQRLAGLPVEAADACGVRGRQTGHPVPVSHGGHLGAGDHAVARPDHVRGKLHIRSRQHLPDPCHHIVLAACRCCSPR